MDGDAVKDMQRRGLKIVAVEGPVRGEWQRTAEATYPSLRGDYCPAELFDAVTRLRDAFRKRAEGTR